MRTGFLLLLLALTAAMGERSQAVGAALLALYSTRRNG